MGGYGYPGDDSSQLKVLFGDGTGGFGDAIIAEPMQKLVAVMAVDIVADPAPGANQVDEVLALSEAGKLFVYSVEDGAFVLLSEFNVSPGANSFDVGDFNRDNKVDIAVANLGDQSIEVYVGSGDGKFALLTTINNVPAPSDIVVDDFDLDGHRDDIAVSNFYTDANLGQSGPPKFELPSTVTILRLDVAESTVQFSSGMSPTVDFTFPAADPDVLLDVTGDGAVSALDALVVINALRRNSSAEGEQIATSPRADADVNGDGQVSGHDALMIINYIARQESQTAVGRTADFGLFDDSDDDDDDDRIAAIDLVLTQLLV